MRVDTIDNISIIDDCHNFPFAESYNDTITNGIALCSILYRAFDRGLFSISNDFKVLLKNNFSEPNKSSYNLKQFEGIKIILPENPCFFHSKDSLSHHRKIFDM
jgi:putative restriction endonuclease